MEIQWLEDCDDNMLLSITRSHFLTIEDDLSLGSFKTNVRRVSFNLSKKSYSKDVSKELNDTVLSQVIVDYKLDDNLSLDPTLPQTTQSLKYKSN